MFKRLLCYSLILLSLPVAGLEPTGPDQARRIMTERNLRNFEAGLRMWAADNSGRYPARLDELCPNYLRHIPAGPGGSAADWDYARSPDGRAYEVKVKGNYFGLGEGFPRMSSSGGGQPERLQADAPFPLRVARGLPGWKEVGSRNWTQGRQEILAILAGPCTMQQDGPGWVADATRTFREFVEVEREQPVRFGRYSGIELWANFHDYRTHRFFLTDGKLGWEVFYGAPTDEYDERVEAAFAEMVAQAAERVESP